VPEPTSIVVSICGIAGENVGLKVAIVRVEGRTEELHAVRGRGEREARGPEGLGTDSALPANSVKYELSSGIGTPPGGRMVYWPAAQCISEVVLYLISPLSDV
jgi:hypothetical protein